VEEGKGQRSSLEERYRAFFCEHVTRVREFVRAHPSHALVEVDIEDEYVGERLASLFEGVDSTRWGQANKNAGVKKIPKT